MLSQQFNLSCLRASINFSTLKLGFNVFPWLYSILVLIFHCCFQKPVVIVLKFHPVCLESVSVYFAPVTVCCFGNYSNKSIPSEFQNTNTPHQLIPLLCSFSPQFYVWNIVMDPHFNHSYETSLKILNLVEICT